MRALRIFCGLTCLFVALLISSSALPAAAARPSAVPNGFIDEIVPGLNAISQPTAFAFLPDGRMLITSQGGDLLIYQDGALLASPALSVRERVCSNGERGLLGVTADSNFSANGYIYIYYTFKKYDSCSTNVRETDPVNRLARYRLAANSAVEELVLIDNIPSPNSNHNGGDLQFGNDGYLYIGVGDGGKDYDGGGAGGANDVARDKHTLLGKILRLTRDGDIPADNPFQGANDSARCYDPAAGGNKTAATTPGKHCRETFAWGLRNPFRLAFDPNTSATRFFINDVGQNRSEEIDEGLSGADYGWNCYEGTVTNNTGGPCSPLPSASIAPVFEYQRSPIPTGQPTFFNGCNSITGGAFVPNGVWPATYDGAYLFGDFVCGRMFMLSSVGDDPAASLFTDNLGGSSVTHLAFGPDGATRSLYYADYLDGDIRRVRYVGSANRSPTAALAADLTFGEGPLAVSFDASASSDPDADPLSEYAWDFGDGASITSAQPNITHTYQQIGVYTATLSVSDSRGARSPALAQLRIDVGNSPPVLSIGSPSADTRFSVGQQITLQGSATDQQDGPLSGASLSWEVRLHHDSHIHPYLSGSGNGLLLTTPAPEDLAAAANSYLELIFSAEDSLGRTSTITRELQPHKVNLTFQTQPAGLQINLAGASSGLVAPQTVVSWAAYPLAVSVAEQQSLAGVALRFCAWSSGAAASHTLITPAAEQSYTAIFVPVGEPCQAVTPALPRLFFPMILSRQAR